MNKYSLRIAAALAVVAVTSCSQADIQPPVKTIVNPVTQTTLQFAVGTANVAGTVGLNTVSTLRQSSGASKGDSVLTNSPSIVGPPGFKVPNVVDAYGDAGTGSITGSLQTNLNTAPNPTTFDPAYGGEAFNAIASSLGFIPATLPQASTKPNLFPYPLPFYASQNPALTTAATPSLCLGEYSAATGGGQQTAFNNAAAPGADTQLCYVGGPPSFVASGHTSTQDGSFNAGDPGFNLGFDDFQVAPVAGTYTLNVTIPTGINANSGVSGFSTKTATASLTSLTALAGWTAPPTFTSDGTGGGTVTTNFAGGAGITEEYIEVVDSGPGACQASGAAPYFYTFKVTPGTATVTVPDNIGAAGIGKTQGHTFCTTADDSTATAPATTGDTVLVYGFAADYPLFSSAFPQSSGQVAPTIVGSTGQADITTSVATTTTE